MRRKCNSSSLIAICLLPITALVVFLVAADRSVAREITLDDALLVAMGQSSRGNIIEGNFQVAEQNYRAKRINFYVPEISINGSLPSYDRAKRYDFAQGATDRSLIETRDLGLSSFIRLKQSLITGGDLEVTANLTADDYRRPNLNPAFPDADFVYEDNRRGYFSFSYAQPLLKPSESKNDLNNRRDDLEIARYTRLQEEQALKTEVTETYMGVLQTALSEEIASLKARQGLLKAEIDSMKLTDGILSEEEYLESSSTRLDSELEQFEAQTAAREKMRELAMLLDFDVSEPIEAVTPIVHRELTAGLREDLVENWKNTVAIKKAEYEYQKSRRAAEYAASSHGLTGDLALSYSIGKEDARTEITEYAINTRSKLNTNSWGVALNFTYPIWDGGASEAAVMASQHQADQSRLEFEKTKRSARAEIINAVNRLDVNRQRLDIVEKQIGLAENRLNIAEERYADGQISELTYLDSKISYLEAKDRYLEELKKYLVNWIELDYKYAG